MIFRDMVFSGCLDSLISMFEHLKDQEFLLYSQSESRLLYLKPMFSFILLFIKYSNAYSGQTLGQPIYFADYQQSWLTTALCLLLQNPSSSWRWICASCPASSLIIHIFPMFRKTNKRPRQAGCYCWYLEKEPRAAYLPPYLYPIVEHWLIFLWVLALNK